MTRPLSIWERKPDVDLGEKARRDAAGGRETAHAKAAFQAQFADAAANER